MVSSRTFFDAFARRLPATGELIVDVRSNDAIDREGFKAKVDAARRYFVTIPHAPGDKAVLFLDNTIDSMAILLALFDVDWVIVPLNPGLNRKKAEYLIRHSLARLLVTSRAVQERTAWLKEVPCRTVLSEEIVSYSAFSRRIRSSCRVDQDLKFILYTSGTVGSPKGVMLSRNAVRRKILDLVQLLRLKPGTAFFSFLPFFSGHGMIPGMLVPLFAGCRMVIAKFDPFLALRFWGFVKKYRIHSFTAVPSVLALLREQARGVRKEDLKYLRTVFSASSPLSQATYDWYADRLGIHVRNCYGLTETASWIAVSGHSIRREKAEYVGKALKGEIVVFGPHGKKLGPRTIGEFGVKTPYNMMGYFRDPEATRDAVTRSGFLKTGDVGYLTRDGKVFFLNRIKQIIIKNGINVYPAEIDQVFLEHPGVKDAASFGIPDAHYGEEIVTALVVRKGRKSREKFLSYAMNELPSFLLPKDVFFLKDFPRGATGKPQIAKMREQYLKEGR